MFGGHACLTICVLYVHAIPWHVAKWLEVAALKHQAALWQVMEVGFLSACCEFETVWAAVVHLDNAA
jgi:hypothetical protein